MEYEFSVVFPMKPPIYLNYGVIASRSLSKLVNCAKSMRNEENKVAV